VIWVCLQAYAARLKLMYSVLPAVRQGYGYYLGKAISGCLLYGTAANLPAVKDRSLKRAVIKGDMPIFFTPKLI
jgi:hypothetical protein